MVAEVEAVAVRGGEGDSRHSLPAAPCSSVRVRSGGSEARPDHAVEEVARQEIQQGVQQHREEQRHDDGLRLRQAVTERDQSQHDERELLVRGLYHMRVRGRGEFRHGAGCLRWEGTAAASRVPILRIPTARPITTPVTAKRLCAKAAQSWIASAKCASR